MKDTGSHWGKLDQMPHGKQRDLKNHQDPGIGNRGYRLNRLGVHKDARKHHGPRYLAVKNKLAQLSVEGFYPRRDRR